MCSHYRLSKELQQKDKVIESLRTKLNQHHHSRSDTPCSSHALSDTTDQSDRISYVSDEHRSTDEDLDAYVDAAGEHGHRDTRTSGRVGTAPAPVFTSTPFHLPPSFFSSSSPTQREPLPFHPHPATLRTRYQGSGGVGFSLAEVHQELQMLQRQLGDNERFSTPQSKPLQGFPFARQQPDSSALLPPSYHGYQPSPFSSGLEAGSTMKAGSGLLESSALWDMSYGTRPVRLCADLSSGSSGYQSGTSNTGAPTNIYIQGLDSVGQLSSEIRLVKEENVGLQNQLKQAAREGSKDADQLREAQLEAEMWAEQSRKLHAEAEARGQEVAELKQDRQKNQEAVNRLQHEVSVLQQQLCESRCLLHSLQSELQVHHRVCGVNTNTSAGRASDGATLGQGAVTFDLRELHLQLEQQLSGQADAQPRSRRQLFNGQRG
ncbi:Myomegalin [Liparis tanakae]|uniref:Myomegalin n=1 Tax=Liparis tanakae TaxID=230148 RepID=A0A4Z2I9P8_9TELE|nr:Myomegalin [Liparis tanakae]